MINNVINHLKVIVFKIKTVAQKASDQAKELLLAALTQGSQKDKEIANMMRGSTWQRGGSTCCHCSHSVPSGKKWMQQPKLVESSEFSPKIVPDISMAGKNSDEDPLKEVLNLLGKRNNSCPASLTISFRTFQPPKYIEQFPGLKNILCWNFDIFKFSIETSSRPLSTMFMWMCSQMNIEIGIVGINVSKLSSFIQEVESNYGDNPYHNFLHGADVLHSSFNLLQSTFLKENLNLEHRFALLFASAVHDFRHPGVGNDFLIKTGSKMATTYNDRSVLENWHTSQAFSLLKESEFNFLAKVHGPAKAIIRGSTIQAVLMTDMKQHSEHVKELQNLIEQSSSQSEPIDPLKLISYALHVSDLSHPTKVFDIHMEWSNRLTREFLEQGDRELELGMEPDALFDRRRVNMEKGQIGFIDFIILPLWINWTTFIGANDEWINQINFNKEEWQRRAGVGSQEKESQSSSISEAEIERLGNEELRFVCPEEATLPNSESSSNYITSSKFCSLKEIKSSSWQQCPKGQSVDDNRRLL